MLQVGLLTKGLSMIDKRLLFVFCLFFLFFTESFIFIKRKRDDLFKFLNYFVKLFNNYKISPVIISILTTTKASC